MFQVLRGPLDRPGSSAALHDLLHGGGGQQDSPFQRRGEDHGVRGRPGTATDAGRCHRLPDRRQPVASSSGTRPGSALPCC